MAILKPQIEQYRILLDKSLVRIGEARPYNVFARTYSQIANQTFDVFEHDLAIPHIGPVVPILDLNVSRIGSLVELQNFHEALGVTFGLLSHSHSMFRRLPGAPPTLMSLLPGIPPYVPPPDDD